MSGRGWAAGDLQLLDLWGCVQALLPGEGLELSLQDLLTLHSTPEQ